MNHIAHIEGLQDNILSNLSDSHLLKIRTFSNHWIKPSHTVINTRLESYIQKFKKLVGYIPTSPHDDLDATPKNQTGYAWHRARWSNYALHFLDRTGLARRPLPNCTGEITKKLRYIYFTNTRASYKHLKMICDDFYRLSEKYNLYHIDNGSKEWIHPLYECAHWLITERVLIEHRRKKLVRLFHLTLTKKKHRQDILNFSKATRPDLMISRLNILISHLQK